MNRQRYGGGAAWLRWTVPCGPIMAQEIVRGIVGTLGLIAAVRITTALTALASTRRAAPEYEVPQSRARHRVL